MTTALPLTNYNKNSRLIITEDPTNPVHHIKTSMDYLADLAMAIQHSSPNPHPTAINVAFDDAYEVELRVGIKVNIDIGNRPIHRFTAHGCRKRLFFRDENPLVVRRCFNTNSHFKDVERIVSPHFSILINVGSKKLVWQQGTAIIISPLIALMKNQVDLVRGYSENDEVAHFLNSSLNSFNLSTKFFAYYID